MTYAALGWIEQYMLPRAKVDSQLNTNTPGTKGLPYPIFLEPAFIPSDLAERNTLQFTGISSCSLPPRLTVSSDNSHCPDHGRVPHKPCNDGMADRYMGFDVVLETHLQSSDLSLD